MAAAFFVRKSICASRSEIIFSNAGIVSFVTTWAADSAERGGDNGEEWVEDVGKKKRGWGRSGNLLEANEVSDGRVDT